jgi:hypothetical protein
MEVRFRDWWEAYFRTCLERDLPQLSVQADPLFLRRVLTPCLCTRSHPDNTAEAA